MSRYVSFRDFDWLLLVFVLIICGLGVMEIRSATMHTKFVGFHKMQVLWLIGGLVAMFVFSVIDYHFLVDFIHWIYGFCVVSLVAVLAVGTKVLGARRWIKLPGGIRVNWIRFTPLWSKETSPRPSILPAVPKILSCVRFGTD